MSEAAGHEPIRILMIDDSDPSFRTLRAMLTPQRGTTTRYALTHTGDTQAGRADMRAGGHDCYLVDYRLRGESGVDLVRDARAAGVTRPIVMLTASNGVEGEAAEAGANDFLVKGEFDRALLERTIRYAINNAQGVQRLAEMNASLEATVAERTAQYVEANRQLLHQIDARERAEAALVQAERLQALGRMTGSVAHDFNNILTALSGSLELLGERLGERLGNPVEPRLARPLATAVEAARLGERMVEGLLAFARRRPVAQHLLRLQAVIAELEPLLRMTLGEAVALGIETDPHLSPVLVDREQLERVLLNLASNARDAAADRPGARFTLSTRDLGDGTVELSAADNGPGMSPETLEHAFEPFFTTKTAGQGTGLGLAQVYGFAVQSGGQAAIDSCPGEGVRVRLSMPAADGRVAAVPVFGTA